MNPPPKNPANPAVTHDGSLTLTGPNGRSDESFDLVKTLCAALEGQGHAVVNHGAWCTHVASGMELSPGLVDLRLDNGSIHTVSTVQVDHPRLATPGLFEYQHSSHRTLAEALEQGIQGWLMGDFPTLLDAVSEKPSTCTYMVAQFPPDGDRAGRVRRVIFGPIAHYVQNPSDCQGEEHPFCPCCLFTNNAEAFKGLLERDDTIAIRMFAARDGANQAQADCRINGEDYEPGMEGLRAYVRDWKPAGFEFRKQYVILQTVDSPE